MNNSNRPTLRTKTGATLQQVFAYATAMLDPRPLNRQVLEASGFEQNPKWKHVFSRGKVLVSTDHRPDGKFTTQLGLVDSTLETIGDFRRFCSLPGIEIQVVVPEDYES